MYNNFFFDPMSMALPKFSQIPCHANIIQKLPFFEIAVLRNPLLIQEKFLFAYIAFRLQVMFESYLFFDFIFIPILEPSTLIFLHITRYIE